MQDHYKQSSEWAYDLYQSQKLWLRRTLFALMVMSVLLLLSLLSHLLLLPLKEKVPYLYAFDHASGEITKIGKLDRSKFSADWTMTRYLLIHYVINRESFDNDNINVPYQLVWSQSDDHVKKQYEEEVSSSNAQSPYQIYGKDKYITVRVIAVNRLNDDTADIKLEKNLHDRASESVQSTEKEAIIKWKYAAADTTQKMLDRDPLGFKVTYYKTTQVNLEK